MPTHEIWLRNPYLICDLCRGAHKVDECGQRNPTAQVCLSGGDIYDDPSLPRFYQNDDTPPWGNNQRKEEEEIGPKWVIRSKFEDELADFMLEKKFHTKGIGETLDQHHKEIHEQFSCILTATEENKILESGAPTFSITTRSGASIVVPLFQIHHNQQPPTKQKEQSEEKDPKTNNDDEERFLSISKQIHVNMPILEAMIHMPKGAKVLKVLLSHKEKLEKEASLVKFSEECSAVIQRSLPPKGRRPRQFYSTVSYRTLDILEMDEHELVPIILGRPFLATARAVIDIHEGRLSLRVDTVDHDDEWIKTEEGRDSNEVHAVSFFPKAEPVEPLEWKALENLFKPSSVKPPKLELKELPEHLEYAFLQEDKRTTNS
nr:hypothetical protein [Tanacetum cinerariifolium]